MIQKLLSILLVFTRVTARAPCPVRRALIPSWCSHGGGAGSDKADCPPSSPSFRESKAAAAQDLDPGSVTPGTPAHCSTPGHPHPSRHRQTRLAKHRCPGGTSDSTWELVSFLPRSFSPSVFPVSVGAVTATGNPRLTGAPPSYLLPVSPLSSLPALDKHSWPAWAWLWLRPRVPLLTPPHPPPPTRPAVLLIDWAPPILSLFPAYNLATAPHSLQGKDQSSLFASAAPWSPVCH